MPKWGLTPNQLKSGPWGLPTWALASSKTITNAVEDDVFLTVLEVLVLDSPSVQRLRRVRQLGTSHQVYPDGVHTRFGHVLGALRMAQDLLDAAIDQQQRPHSQPDLFQEWRETVADSECDHRIAEATVLARLGALLHDLTHVPFGHSLEDDLGLLVRHDGNVARFEALWEQLNPKALDVISADLKEELRWLILSKAAGSRSAPSRYPWVEDIVGNTICADLLDYLPRDHQNLGLPIALGHRFLDSLFVTPSSHPKPQRVIIQVERNGHERSDVISELLKVLRYRYEESERVLFHHAKLATDAMIAKLLAMWRDSMWVDEAALVFAGSLPDELRHDVDELRSWVTLQPADDLRLVCPPGTDGADPANAIIAFIDERVQDRLERQMRMRGDDGLIEHLCFDLASEQSDSRLRAIATLAENVLDRKLYKQVGSSSKDDRKHADRVWNEWGDKDARRRLEREAARYVGLDEGWHVVIWIPRPEMKLKSAQVLVGLENRQVFTLEEHSPRCKEIYQAHEDLWAVKVFAHPSIREDDLRREALLAWLRERLRLGHWENNAERSTAEVAVDHFARVNNLTMTSRDKLLGAISGKGDPPETFGEMLAELEVLHETQ